MVRLITVADVKVGMITLERNGRARVFATREIWNGYNYCARYTEGPYLGEECSCDAVPGEPVWIEEA